MMGGAKSVWPTTQPRAIHSSTDAIHSTPSKRLFGSVTSSMSFFCLTMGSKLSGNKQIQQTDSNNKNDSKDDDHARIIASPVVPLFEDAACSERGGIYNRHFVVSVCFCAISPQEQLKNATETKMLVCNDKI